ncbi:MAG: sigma 54-interacting transcriptional regulator, partial [Nitrospinaceae bacterium]
MEPEDLQEIAALVASERSVERVLTRVVEGVARMPHIALSRIWLLRPGDICAACSMAEECPDRAQCLHLAASEGSPLSGDPAGRWNRLDGAYKRFPLGVRKVGQIGATGEPLLLTHVGAESSWMRDPQWARRENIQSFAGQPLVFRGETLGVLAVFSRTRLTQKCLNTLRLFADQAAAAIANARAFEEIAHLKEQLELENEYLREEVHGPVPCDSLVGQSSALHKIVQQVQLVAPTDASVLILGESGTGKELVARAIHYNSGCSGRPMIKVNCASIPRDLFESEFFGHVKGAFTGAVKDRAGRFQLADQSTLFLDEVGEIPLELQGKLLRVLQEGQFERVGEEFTRQVKVRIIGATNRDLKQEVQARRFRQDLYYRLSVFHVEVPSLRDRLDDIPLLARHFIKKAAEKLGVPAPRLKYRHVQQLQNYAWPGNIRELDNVIERAMITRQGENLKFDLPDAAPAAFQEFSS